MRRERLLHVACAGGAVGLLTLSFMLLYWNRFLAPSSGATSFYAAEQILQGKVPYRDFSFLTPPLHALKIAALIRLFGETLAIPRIEAMVERTVLAVILFVWLSRCCRISAAFLGTAIAMIVFAGDLADSLANYHHDSVFWAVAAGFCANLCLDRSRPSILLALASGFLAGLSFLTKQTTGTGVFLVIPALIALLAFRAGAIADVGRFMLPYVVGWLSPLSAFLIWLYREKSLRQFWSSVFLNGGSKGSLFTILTRPFLQMPYLVVAALVVILLLVFVLHSSPDKGRPESSLLTVVYGFAGAGILIAGVWTGHSAGICRHFIQVAGQPSDPRAPVFLNLFISFHWFVILLAFLATGAAFLYLSRRMLRITLTQRDRTRWFMSGVAFAVAYMLALSWPAYSPMVVPSLAIAVALALDRLERSASPVRYAVAALVCVVMYAHVSYKLIAPFGWMFWQEPPAASASNRSTLPELQGLQISRNTLDIAEKVTAIIRAYTGPGDTILVYPYFPLFYVLSHRNPPTYGFNHFLDVCPDAVCSSDAKVILRNRPAVIVYMVERKPAMEALENAYRGGKVSASREMVAAIEQLAAGYRLLYTFVTPGPARRVNVYVRS